MLGADEDSMAEVPFKQELAKIYSLDSITVDHLYSRYGLSTAYLLEAGKNGENKEIAHNILESEVRYAVEVEKAVKINDIICRRVGLSFYDLDKAKEAVKPVGEIMGKLLNWTEVELLSQQAEALSNLEYHI